MIEWKRCAGFFCRIDFPFPARTLDYDLATRGEGFAMVQGYYTLQEASKVLGMPVDELKQMAQKGKIRSFQEIGRAHV